MEVNLTSKEYHVVEAICCRALGNKDIGKELGTSEQMIKNHTRQIFDKTGTEDRLALCVWYYNGGRERITLVEPKRITVYVPVSAPQVIAAAEPAAPIVSAAEIRRRQQQ